MKIRILILVCAFIPGLVAAADAEKGRLLVEHAAAALIELLIEMDRYPLNRLVDPGCDPDQ